MVRSRNHCRGGWGRAEAGSDERMLPVLFLVETLFGVFCSFRSFLQKWKKI